MPAIVVFHKAYAAAHKGLGDDAGWASLDRLRFREGRAKLADIVSITLDDVEVERTEFIPDWIQLQYVLGASIDLAIIAIDDHREIVKLPVRGDKRGFPDLAFAQFSISGHTEDAAIVTIDSFIGERHADCDSEPLAERTGRAFNSRQAHITARMPLKARFEFSEREELGLREKSGISKRCV